MINRRSFLKNTGILTCGSFILPIRSLEADIKNNPGIQLYTVRKEMMTAPVATLQKLAAMGIKQVESASSEKGHYYGLSPKEMSNICKDYGMTLRSGHVSLDENWSRTVAEAAAAGQEYLVIASLPSSGQTIDHYKEVADQLNIAGLEAKKSGIRLGYHNHDAEFEKADGTTLYDVLLEETESAFVCFEMDLGWVLASGNDPLAYFRNYPGRFLLWHLKDMNLKQKKSTEFGKGSLPIKAIFDHYQQSGLRYFFIEQEDYALSPLESIRYNLNYLKNG